MVHAVASVLALAVVVTACRAKPGDRCKREATACADPSTLLRCDKTGVYASIPCSGGCKNGVCDWSKSKGGDACSYEDTPKVCSSDHKRLLECFPLINEIGERPCVGPRGCHPDGAGVACEAPAVGDPCEGSGTACATGETLLLRCVAGRWASERPCRSKCTERVVGVPACDVSNSEEGDACRAEEEGRVVCTVDEMAMVRCSAGRFARADACPPGKKCWNKHDRTEVDVVRYPDFLAVLPTAPVCR